MMAEEHAGFEFRHACRRLAVIHADSQDRPRKWYRLVYHGRGRRIGPGSDWHCAFWKEKGVSGCRVTGACEFLVESIGEPSGHSVPGNGGIRSPDFFRRKG